MISRKEGKNYDDHNQRVDYGFLEVTKDNLSICLDLTEDIAMLRFVHNGKVRHLGNIDIPSRYYVLGTNDGISKYNDYSNKVYMFDVIYNPQYDEYDPEQIRDYEYLNRINGVSSTYEVYCSDEIFEVITYLTDVINTKLGCIHEYNLNFNYTFGEFLAFSDELISTSNEDSITFYNKSIGPDFIFVKFMRDNQSAYLMLGDKILGECSIKMSMYKYLNGKEFDELYSVFGDFDDHGKKLLSYYIYKANKEVTNVLVSSMNIGDGLGDIIHPVCLIKHTFTTREFLLAIGPSLDRCFHTNTHH